MKETSSTPTFGVILPDIVSDTILPNGRRNIYLFGRRNQPGFFVERLIFPAGYTAMPHIHNGNLYVTICKGSCNVVMDREFDTTIEVRTYDPVVPLKKSSLSNGASVTLYLNLTS